MIRGAGLEEYYRLRAEFDSAAPSERSPNGVTDSSYRDFDAPAFARQYTELLAPDRRVVQLYLDGVRCAACLWLVEKLPSLLGGVRAAHLDLQRRVLEVHWDPALIELSAICRKLEQLGYPPLANNDARARAARRTEERKLLMRLGIAGAVAGNVMLLSFALYSGAFQGMSPEFQKFFEITSLVVSLPSLTYSAAEFYRGALSALKTRTPHMDLPVSLGIVAGATWGMVNVLRGAGDTYFDTVTALVFLLLVGRYLEMRQQNRARQAVERAQMLVPSRARVLTPEGNQKEVLVEEIAPGDLVIVRSGETMPVDGVVVSGSSELDNQVLSGESRPVTVHTGDEVFAGATNLTGALRVQSTSAGAETRVARLLREVERARRRRAPVVRLADRVAGKFIVAVLVLAVITLMLWWSSGADAAVGHTVALLIVACPCALAMATPLAVSAALARAAERRILIKGGDVLESVLRPCLIVFDKTGTLTTGRLVLVAWEGDRAVQGAVRALETSSSHPVARAFCQALQETSSEPIEALREEPGGGLTAKVGGRVVAVGSPSWLKRLGMTFPSWVETSLSHHAAQGRTPVAIGVGSEVVALAVFEDAVRDDAASSLRGLKELGYRIAILSGDDPRVTQAVAHRLADAARTPELFDEVIGGSSPEAKLRYVESQRRSGPVVVVGDGVNDAAALAAASVGVAVKGGAEASMLAADVFLAETGVRHLLGLVDGARRTLRTVRRGIAVSLLYNVVGVTLAMSGLLGPLVAAILMPLSSLTVVANAYRSRSFEEQR